MAITLISSTFIVKADEVEYQDAEYIWNFLQEQGYNDHVCAGILGNMIVECGGLTLDLQISIDGGGYYGICQWSNEYYPELKDTTLEEQCEHLADSMERIINLFGSENEYDKFIQLEDEKEAALIFAKYYEVCWSGSYEIRQECASEAYNYFVIEKKSTDTGALTTVIQNHNVFNYFWEEMQ